MVFLSPATYSSLFHVVSIPLSPSLQCSSLKRHKGGLCGSGPLNSNFLPCRGGTECIHWFNWHLLITQCSASAISLPPPPKFGLVRPSVWQIWYNDQTASSSTTSTIGLGHSTTRHADHPSKQQQQVEGLSSIIGARGDIL